MKTTIFKRSGMVLKENARKGKKTVYTTYYNGVALVCGFNREQVLKASFEPWFNAVVTKP